MLKKLLIYIVCIAAINIVFALLLSPTITQICALFNINMTGAKAISLSALICGAVILIWAMFQCLDAILNWFTKDE